MTNTLFEPIESDNVLPTVSKEMTEDAKALKQSILDTVSKPYRYFTTNEYMTILNDLQARHSLFYQFWNLGKPSFSYRIPTAAVGFSKEGECVTFTVNPDFWDRQTPTQQSAIIAHECLHVSLNHGVRGISKMGVRANRMMDVVVNHALVDQFGYSRTEFDPDNNYCWIDTCFGEHAPTIKEGQSFEYYFKKHLELFPEDENGGGQDGGGSGSGQVMDDHSEMDDSPEAKKAMKELLDQIGENLTEEEKEQIKDFIERSMAPEQTNRSTKSAGGAGGNQAWYVPKKKVIKKKKWETIIKKWAKKFINHKDNETDQWARVNRRLTSLNHSFFLPSEMEIEEDFNQKCRIQVWFFSDTSGSCAGYMSRFFAAAESLPIERFDVKMHCFDTAVYETTLASRKLYGFGGTAFCPIEEYIQQYCASKKVAYPDAVFVVTDGYATDHVKPQRPEKWHWFLTPDGQKGCYDERCNTYKLENFE